MSCIGSVMAVYPVSADSNERTMNANCCHSVTASNSSPLS